ncbi:serine hydrolase [Allorhodopirellula heiligendammensis]|uniref:Penicillin-binding protein PbpX n=1 Tax=Allorhodopirellula heiligendammensis TaxID=2714739 RepID=A0A5C6BGZ0_9BACT|nr:serine hydrolase [Allorhodopirellula heiligendammensis]TWU10917.1 putative penicillin-binding protein PbpX [Allorhodopirellula heiligendammensis]
MPAFLLVSGFRYRSGSMSVDAILKAALRPAVFGVAVAIVVVACSSAMADEGSAANQAQTGPPGDPHQSVTRENVDTALAGIPELVENMRRATGVPGMAIAVVFEDEVVYSAGFGVCKLGSDDPVGPDTVFQIASLSKALSATAVAAIVGDGTIAWEDPVVDHLPDFRLSDAYVTEHVTYADLFSHRSGLPAHAGDLLEDLGFDRREVLARLAQQPLFPFRAQHDYTNFGLTAAAEAAAVAAGIPWEELIKFRLFNPAGMEHSSARFEDYVAAENRATPHQRDVDGNWIVTTHQRDPDAQSPAGGICSTANDLGQWLRLQLAGGVLSGEPIIDPAALLAMQTPHSFKGPLSAPSAHANLYGLGMGISVRDDGYTSWSHSGAFLLGTGTNFSMIPGQRLGVVTITNGQPVGLAEATADTVLDLIVHGKVSRDWLGGYMGLFANLYQSETPTDWTELVNNPVAPASLGTYAGTYENDYYGPMMIDDSSGTLVMTLGPQAMTFNLTPYDGDTFLFTPPGENSVGPTGITFEVEDGQSVSVSCEFYDMTGLGTWTRSR